MRTLTQKKHAKTAFLGRTLREPNPIDHSRVQKPTFLTNPQVISYSPNFEKWYSYSRKANEKNIVTIQV